MMAKQLIKKLFSKKLLLIWLAIFTWLVGQLMASFPFIAERVYSQGIYPIVATILSAFSGLFPFSLDDLFYTLLVLLLVVLLIFLFLKKLKLKEFFILITNTLAAGYILFYFLWGFNYYRQDFNTRLAIPESKANKNELLSVLEQLVLQTNDNWLPVDSVDKTNIDSIIENSYRKHSDLLKISYPSGSRRPKNITYSRFFSQAMISGYYGPFFSEVHVNKNVLPVEYPMVLAHEKAHQLGITGEAEANFYAWLVCSQSNCQPARYSANLYILRYFAYEAARFEEAKPIMENLREEVRSDYKKIRTHWLALRNEKIDEVAGKVNDAYLKANKVEKGIDDYSGVVKYIMDFKTVVENR